MNILSADQGPEYFSCKNRFYGCVTSGSKATVTESENRKLDLFFNKPFDHKTNVVSRQTLVL